MPYERIVRDPDDIPTPQNVSMTKNQHKIVSLAAKELKLSVGKAMVLLAQNFLDELDSEPLN